MQIITGTDEFQINSPTAVAIGKFDGIHVGHQKLLETVFAQKEKGLSACVFTFDPSPAVFFGRADGRELTTRNEKRHLFEKMGVDVLIEFPMNAGTAAMSPEHFVSQILSKGLQAKLVVAGTDVSFGAYGAGNATLLSGMSRECGFDLKLIDKVCVQGREVSSTYVRETVEQGDMELAKKLLGMPYGICGNIVHGRQLGRTIGVPTINLCPPPEKLLPPFGVYFSRVIWQGESYEGISNIGCKPTVSDPEDQVGIETFIYDFDREIYEEEIKVELCAFHRAEQKFASVEELQVQLGRDIEAGRKYFTKSQN